MQLPDITDWPASEVEAMCGDQHLWEPVVREIASREGLACGKIEAGFPSSSAVVLLDGGLVLKVLRPSSAEDAAVEAFLLQYLETTAVRGQPPVGGGTYGHGYRLSFESPTDAPEEKKLSALEEA